jgi:hypothetical protein
MVAGKYYHTPPARAPQASRPAAGARPGCGARGAKPGGRQPQQHSGRQRPDEDGRDPAPRWGGGGGRGRAAATPSGASARGQRRGRGPGAAPAGAHGRTLHHPHPLRRRALPPGRTNSTTSSPAPSRWRRSEPSIMRGRIRASPASTCPSCPSPTGACTGGCHGGVQPSLHRREVAPLARRLVLSILQPQSELMGRGPDRAGGGRPRPPHPRPAQQRRGAAPARHRANNDAGAGAHNARKRGTIGVVAFPLTSPSRRSDSARSQAHILIIDEMLDCIPPPWRGG